jgi:peptidoglycan/LPS O-acetylase OafA/YrhL
VPLPAWTHRLAGGRWIQLEPDPTSYKLSENSSLALDLLRAGASQAVVIGHGISFFGILPALQPPHFPYIQNLAVVVFFVLSGFLITYATLRKPPDFGFGEFFIDRFARIYSAYLIALLIVWAIDLYAIGLDPATYTHTSALDLRTFIGNVFMLQDHPREEVHALLLAGSDSPGGTVTSFGSARPFWTLAIEWWIYMGFGWLVLGGRGRSMALYLVVLAPLLVVPLYNIVGGRGNGLALVWILGAAMFVLASRRRVAVARSSVLVGGAVLFGALSLALLASTRQPYDPRYGALFAAALLCLVLAVDRLAWKAPAWLAAAIRFVANYSFTLYLLHYTVLELIARHPVFGRPTANFVLAVVIANVLSIVVAYVTEFRHRELGRWLKRKRLGTW